jgi:biotin transport system substrate-specific component
LHPKGQNMTLARKLVSSQSLMTRALMVLGGSAFIALSAQVSVPMLPVPMTLQTLAVLLVGFAFGARMGAVTLLAYLAEGAAGLPVFANGMNGAALVGPTAGFLAGFVPMAWLVGLAADRGVKGFAPTVAVALAVSVALYLPGLAVLSGFVGGFDKAVAIGAQFLPGDAVKSVLAAMVTTGAWAALSRR